MAATSATSISGPAISPSPNSKYILSPQDVVANTTNAAASLSQDQEAGFRNLTTTLSDVPPEFFVAFAALHQYPLDPTSCYMSCINLFAWLYQSNFNATVSSRTFSARGYRNARFKFYGTSEGAEIEVRYIYWSAIQIVVEMARQDRFTASNSKLYWSGRYVGSLEILSPDSAVAGIQITTEDGENSTSAVIGRQVSDPSVSNSSLEDTNTDPPLLDDGSNTTIPAPNVDAKVTQFWEQRSLTTPRYYVPMLAIIVAMAYDDPRNDRVRIGFQSDDLPPPADDVSLFVVPSPRLRAPYLTYAWTTWALLELAEYGAERIRNAPPGENIPLREFGAVLTRGPTRSRVNVANIRIQNGRLPTDQVAASTIE